MLRLYADIEQSIEFSTLDDEDTNSIAEGDRSDDISQPNGVIDGVKKESLEKLLLARNKKLGDELAVLRISYQDLQRQLESLQHILSNTNADLERSQNLNATLETDLEKVQQEASNAFPSSAMSTAGTYTSRYPSSSYNASSFPNRRGRSSPTSTIISGFDPQSTSRSTLESIRAGEPIGGGSGIMPMIQAQRDRFKQKNTQLEEELSKQHNTVSSLRQEIASLQRDNLNLYEKSRYVSTYSRGAASSSTIAFAQPSNTTAISLSEDTPSGLSLDRYRSTYEANLSPFAAFRGREHTRAYKRMSLPERMVFSITRMVLANRTSRNLFAFYCFSLHVLIFVMLYWMQSADISRNASKFGQTTGPIAGLDEHGDWLQEGFEAGAGT
jgi:homeobox protein cut-like